MNNSNFQKTALTLSFIVLALPLFASNENGTKKIIVGALAGIIVYGGMAIYRSFKNKN